MLGKLSIFGAVAGIFMIPTALSAQMGGAINPGVHVGGAVNPGRTRASIVRGPSSSTVDVAPLNLPTRRAPSPQIWTRDTSLDGTTNGRAASGLALAWGRGPAP
jgi:hypothetical protein